MAPASVDVPALGALAEHSARQAGALLLGGRNRSHREVRTKTSGTDMVSEMDRAAEELIVRCILGARPDDAVLGEEGGQQGPGTSGVRWVVDPLDGTTNYLYDFPRWAVSVAAELDGAVVAGAVSDPAFDDVFTATKGGGAFRNGAPITHSGKGDLATALIGTGFSYLPERRAEQARVLATVLPAVRDIRRQGVASLDLCWVACGRLDGYYELSLQPWDIAAGALIAAEAGAHVSSTAGGPPSADSVFAAAPGLAPALLSLLGRASTR